MLGYQLILRRGSGDEGNACQSARAVLDLILLHGVETLTGGQTAFVPCSAEFLKESLVSALPKELTVLEICQTLEAEPWALEACRKLKERGYRLALADFSWQQEEHPLLALADFVKIDYQAMESSGRDRLRKALAGASTVLIADKVNSRQSYKEALAEGFRHFQGFYFCEPELIQKSKVPSNKLLHAEMVKQLREDPLDLKKVAPLVKRDTALVFRLLKLVNSPLCAIRQEVSSIETAILVLGEATFRRIAMLAVLGELNSGQPAEVLHMALTRARFCELAAPGSKMNAEEQYLVGMLSLLPVMLQQPMENLISELPLRTEIKKALLGEALRERALLSWAEAHERNEPARAYAIADQFELNLQKLEQFYVDAVVWESISAASIH